MFHCQVCNVVTWNTHKEKHLHGKVRPYADDHFTVYGSIEEERENDIMIYFTSENEIDLNTKTAEELIEIKRVLDEIHL